MEILVLPISGGGFVSQLAIIQHLCEVEFVPDVTLATSGGNVAAYVAAAANWKWPAIERISHELSQDLFSKPWNSVTTLSWIIGYFKGNVYNKGSGVGEFLSNHFTPSSIAKHEIWTGTYNKDKQLSRLFCNRSQKESIIDISHIDCDLTQSMEPVFSNSDIALISEAGIASASIPALVPAQKIMGEDYVDGGVASASPLTIMQEALLNQSQNGLHIFYINSVDLSSPKCREINNVLDTWRQAVDDMIRSQTVIDRLSGYEILRCHSGPMSKEEFPCTYTNLQRVKEIQSHVSYSMLEIYPLKRCDIEMVKFNGDDVIKAIREVYGNCGCRFWWLSGSCFDSEDVSNLIGACKNCDPLDI